MANSEDRRRAARVSKLATDEIAAQPLARGAVSLAVGNLRRTFNLPQASREGVSGTSFVYPLHHFLTYGAKNQNLNYARVRALLEQFHKKVHKGLIKRAGWAYKSAGL